MHGREPYKSQLRATIGWHTTDDISSRRARGTSATGQLLIPRSSSGFRIYLCVGNNGVGFWKLKGDFCRGDSSQSCDMKARLIYCSFDDYNYSMNITHRCYFTTLCNKHEHIKFNLVKKFQTPMHAILHTLILWIFNILSKIWFPHIDLTLLPGMNSHWRCAPG